MLKLIGRRPGTSGAPLAGVAVLALAGAVSGCGQAGAPTHVAAFDDVPAGSLPAGWIVAATSPAGELARWQVAADANAPSRPNVLRIAEIRDGSRGVFNLCWTRAPAFRDGSLEVKVRADSGKIDQGGGLIWRARDAGNYYIARYNPLERNLRLYVVQDAKRRMIADAPGLTVPAGQWFTIRAVHRRDRIEVFLDGRKLLEAQDSTFGDAGGVGLWTKADAATSFDDLKAAGP